MKLFNSCDLNFNRLTSRNFFQQSTYSEIIKKASQSFYRLLDFSSMMICVYIARLKSHAQSKYLLLPRFYWLISRPPFACLNKRINFGLHRRSCCHRFWVYAMRRSPTGFMFSLSTKTPSEGKYLFLLVDISRHSARILTKLETWSRQFEEKIRFCRTRIVIAK